MEGIADKHTYRNYLFFWSGQLFSLFGSTIVYFIITIWLTLETGSPTFMAIVGFVYIVPFTICMPIAGVFADRFNKKILILIVDSSQAFITFMLILFFQFGLLNIWNMLIFVSLRSAFQSFHMPVVSSIIPVMVPQDKLTRINGINYLFTGVVQLSAQFAAAGLLVLFSFNQLLWTDIITYLIAIIPLLLITIPSVHKSQGHEKSLKKISFKKEFKTGFRVIKLIPGFMALLTVSVFANFLVTPLDTQLSLYILFTHKGTEIIYALVLGSLYGGMIIGSLVASFKTKWKNKIMSIFASILIVGIGYVAFSIAPIGWFGIIALGGFIMGLSLPIIAALYQTFIQTIVPKDKIGRITSIDHTFSLSLTPIATLISGPIAEVIGINGLYFTCAVLLILITILVWSFSRVRKVDYDDLGLIESVNSEITNNSF